jgi:hypothetical protein
MRNTFSEQQTPPFKSGYVTKNDLFTKRNA